ncbi:MAG: nucleotidyltransferase domain-containing protein [Nanoarchaeota archaeon]
METEIKILKCLLGNKEPKTIRTIAKEIKADYKIVHTASSILLSNGLVEKIKIGSSFQISLVYKLSEKILIAEYQRREEALKNKDLRTILDYFDRNLKSSLYIMLLFGSHVKQTQTKHSDIDLLFIVPKQEMENDINRVASLIPLKIHINVFTEQDFKAMKNSREITVGSEAIKNNIILKGIEAYYGELR